MMQTHETHTTKHAVAKKGCTARKLIVGIVSE
jgi:hypothetical protein